MASIKGISLKNIETFTGREGYGLSTILLMDGKEIGRYLDEGNGGMSSIYVSDKTLKEEFLNRVLLHTGETAKEEYEKYSAADMVINDLTTLSELEEKFVKMKKTGKYTQLIQLYFVDSNDDLETFSKNYKDDVLLYSNESVDIEKILEQYKPKGYNVYRKLEDFNIV